MKLYYSKGACSLSTHIVINELEIDCEFESVDLAKKVTEKGADFYQINPRGAVPTLQLDNGDLLVENLAIQQYLADTFDHERRLCPSVGKIQRYHVLAWLSYASSDLHKSFSLFFAKMVEDAKVLEFATNNLKKKIDHLEKQLKNHDYLAGDHFSLADPYTFVVLRWLGVAKLDIKEWPYVAKYFDRIKSRPAVIKSMQEEGILTK